MTKINRENLTIELHSTGTKKGKIKKITIADYDFFFLPYEEQTKIKHFVFKEYFDVWVKKLGKYYDLNYIDGFGGCGAYCDLSSLDIYFGSPILAAEVIRDQNQNFQNSIVFGIIEKKLENIENLKKVFAFKQFDDSNILYVQGDFDKQINEIIDQHNNLAPTFFLIDPFGFTIKYETLKRIMGLKKTEIFLNFMFNSVQRFLKAPRIEHHLDNLFGCKTWRNIKSTETQKEKEIIDLFCKQLKVFAQYVFPYRLSFPDKDMTYYYMIHLTNNLEACYIMKDAFAKFNEGRVEYIGKKSEIVQLNLFEVGKDNCTDYLLAQYKGRSLMYGELLAESIDQTEFLERHFKESIRSLESQEIVRIIKVPPTTKTGRPKKSLVDHTDIIEF